MNMSTTTYAASEQYSPTMGEPSIAPQLKAIRQFFSDGTTNEYVRITGYAKKFAEHYAKLNSIATDPVLWPKDAERPDDIAVRSAWGVIQQLAYDELLPTNVVASAEGGVAICFVVDDKYADIECLNSGEILGVTSNRRNHPAVWEIEQNPSDIAWASVRISKFLSGNKT